MHNYSNRYDLLFKKKKKASISRQLSARYLSMFTEKLLFSDALKYNQLTLLSIITDNSRALRDGRTNRAFGTIEIKDQ